MVTSIDREETEAGLKPGWRMARFGDVVNNVDINEHDPLANGLERYVGLEHLDPESLYIQRWGLIEEGTSFTRKFVTGQVLFGKRRAYQHKAAVADFDGICSGDILVFEAKDALLPELLPFIVQSDPFYEHALNTSAGSLSPRTKWKDLAAYEFALPSKDEQRRIADILWAADEAIKNFNVVANNIQITRDANRKEKFANKKLPVRLVDLCEPKGIQIGPFGSQLHASDYVDNGIPVIMPSDMSNDEVNETSIARITPGMAARLSLHKVLPDDILLPRRGELDKRVFVLAHQVGWICGTVSIRIRVGHPVLARAVFHALAAPQTVKWIQDHAVGTTMPNLNAQIVSDIPISLPDEQELEHLIQILERLNGNSLCVLENIKKLNSLKKTVMDTILEQKR